MKLTCDVPEDLMPAFTKAAAVWNDVFYGILMFVPAPRKDLAMVRLDIGPVDRSRERHRIAQCVRNGARNLSWTITLASDCKWAVTGWQRFWGLGEDAFVTILHELGHVIGLPHAAEVNYIMHDHSGGNGTLSRREKSHYRKYYLEH